MTREIIQQPGITKPDMKDYGNGVGLGIAIGGGGILGVPFRFNLSKIVALEMGIFLRPIMITKETTYSDGWGNSYGTRKESDFSLPAHINGGFDFFLGENFRPDKSRVVKNGIMLRAGTTLLSDFSETMLSIGWARERFKISRKQSSYIFELGPGVLLYEEGNNPWSEQLGDDYPVVPMIYWKFHWNWYIK